MKKILFTIILAFMLIPSLVYADMGAPVIEPYETMINKVEGAPYYSATFNEETQKNIYEKAGTLDYNQKITIKYEEETNGILYGQFELNKEIFYIKISDIIPISDTFDVNSSEKLDVPEKAIILNKNGVKLYKGPAYGFQKIGTIIPYKTNILVTHAYLDPESAWYYTTYNGVSGWICILNQAVGFESKGELFFSDTTKIRNNNNKIIGTIPANTLFNDTYYTTDGWSRSYYLTYKGTTGYIYNQTIANKYDEPESIEVEDQDIRLYEGANTSSKVLMESIPKNTTYNYFYYTNWTWDEPDFLYIEVNGIKGWIDYCNGLDSMSREKLECEHSYIDKEYEDELSEQISSSDIISSSDNNSSSDADIIVSTNKFTSKQIIILSIAAAIIIAITALVTILLINKKKSPLND